MDLIRLIISCMFAFVLVFAGFAKAYSAVVQLVHFTPESAQFAVIVLASFEMTLAFMLLFHFDRQLSWLIAGLLFLGFACYSFAQASLGARCGCLGQVDVSYWQMLTIDIIGVCLAAVMFVLARAKSQEVAGRMSLALPVFFCGVVLSAVVFVSLFGFDRHFSNPSLTVEGAAHPANDYVPETRQFSCLARVHNLSDRDIRIVGFIPNCGTSYVVEIPATIGRNEHIDIPVVSKLPKGKSNGEVVIEYYADIDGELIQDSLSISVVLGQFAFASRHL